MDWFYPEEVPDIESGFYHEQSQSNRDRRRRHSDFAADIVTRATKAGARYLLRKGFSKLKDAFLSRMAGKRGQTNRMEAAKKKAKTASGASKGRSGNDAGIKPAMFIPGRGAEIPLVTSTFQKPLTLTIGLKSPRLHDPRKALANSFSYLSKSVANGFAFKAVKAYEAPVPNELLMNEYGKSSRYQPDNTFITTHVFRHKDPRGMSPTMGDNSTLWNYTLGPDNAYARRVPGAANQPRGTAFGVVSDYSPLLVTSERFPQTQHDMIPRYSIDANEDNCWNLNPCKMIGVDFETPITAVQSTASQGVPGPLEKYKYVPRAQPLYTLPIHSLLLFRRINRRLVTSSSMVLKSFRAFLPLRLLAVLPLGGLLPLLLTLTLTLARRSTMLSLALVSQMGIIRFNPVTGLLATPFLIMALVRLLSMLSLPISRKARSFMILLTLSRRNLIRLRLLTIVMPTPSFFLSK